MSAVFRQRGLSLIELMIALALGALLTLGLLKVFEASRMSYKLSEGLARVQENGRFAMDYLQRDLRMAGHMGCLNDQTRFQSATPLYRSTFANTETDPGSVPAPLRFDISIQGFEADATAPTSAALSLTGTGAWSGSPQLPAYIASLNPAPLAGSDVVALRYFSAEAIPAAPLDKDRVAVDSERWNKVLAGNGFAAPTLLAIGDCLRATTFEAASVSAAKGGTTISAVQSGLNKLSLDADSFTKGQAMLYRAESMVYYIGLNQARQPALFRARFTTVRGSNSVALLGGRPEQLVDGIENMQLIYGLDLQTDPAREPAGYVGEQKVAHGVQSSADTRPWRRVGLVQVAFLARSTEPAGAPQANNPLTLLGLQVKPPADGRYRSVFESTIALRNRLYGN